MDRDTASLLPGTGVPATPPKQPQGDWLLHVCRVFNAVAALCALFCAVAFGMALVVRFSAPIKDLNFYAGQLVRVYGIGLALLLALVETEARRVLAAVPLLEPWLGRALVQLFEAALTYREAYPRGDTDFHRSLALYRGAACAALTGCAAVYVAGSLLCVEPVKRARARREAALFEVEADLEALGHRRDALRSQLRA